MTLSPDVPSSVPFCGKLIDITRYDMREAYDRELSSFTYFHSTTMLLIKRANRYFPVIEPILKANGIPDDFKYLAVIESHLDPRVSSPARAVGMWQLLEGTAREYGLTITPTVDERCHVEKATGAACRYLKAAYKKYGDWAAVAASYNGGMGRISGELVKQDADSSFDLWLVEETTRYIYRIMAIKQIFENPSKYGFVLRARDLYKPIPTVDVAVSQDIQNLSAFAKKKRICIIRPRIRKYTIRLGSCRRIDPIFIDTKNKVFHLDGITAHRNETLFLYYFSFKLIQSISQRSSHGDR